MGLHVYAEPKKVRLTPETASLKDCEAALANIEGMPPVRSAFQDNEGRAVIVFDTIGITGDSRAVLAQKSSLKKFREQGEPSQHNDVALFPSVESLARAVNVMATAQRSSSAEVGV